MTGVPSPGFPLPWANVFHWTHPWEYRSHVGPRLDRAIMSSRYGWRGVLSLGMLVPGLTRAGGALCQGAWAAGIFPSRARHAVVIFYLPQFFCPKILAQNMESYNGKQYFKIGGIE